MKLTINYKPNYKEIDRLIDRYYDGLTSVKEEQQLHSLLSQKGLPERYKTEQAIFGYFETKKQKPTFSIRPYIRWIGAVAVAVIVVYTVQLHKEVNRSNYAYVDGAKVTNVNEIKSQALVSLGNVSTDNDEVERSLDDLDNSEIMKEQLGTFQDLENSK